MNVSLTKDMSSIANLMQHKDIFGKLSDTPLRGSELYELLEATKENFIYFEVRDDIGIPVGFFSFHEEAESTLQGHVAMLKRGRGTLAKAAGNMIKDILFTHTTYDKLVLKIPINNLSAIRFATTLGFSTDSVSENTRNLYLLKQENSNAA